MSSELVVVVVEESISDALAGHAGRSYVSPAQPRKQAMALVALLLGSPQPSEGGTWTRAIAGGRRVIALHPAD
jgi:hypothetical protein